MKKIYINLMLCMILTVGIISAGAIGIVKTSSIDKASRDAVLSKSGANEINPNWSIIEYEDYILCSGYQEGIINSRDNRISRTYCSDYNETSGDCITESDYSDEEMDNQCVEYIASRIENYGNALIERTDVEDTRAGNVEIGERR